MNKHYDIIIVGGGMVGLAAALALTPTQLKIAIIEGKTPANFDNTDYDMRVISINQSSVNFFNDINVWQDIKALRVSPFDNMFVWADNSSLSFSASELNEPELGFIVENRVLRQTLWQHAEQCANISLLCPQKIESVTIDTKVEITTVDDTFSCDLIIGADGANSWLRNTLQFEQTQTDYGHHALVATVQTELPHQQTAWQHFLSDGPLAFLPLDDEHHCSIVWSSNPEKISELKALDNAQFNQALAHAFQSKLGEVETISPRVSFPLQKQHLKEYVAEHVAFIGDAAHRIHPLAGQGANLGFMDAKRLASVIDQALTKKQPIAALRTLQRYQRERKYYNGKMLVIMDALKTIFATSSPTLSTLRNIAIEKIDQNQFIKQFFTKSAR